MILRLRHFLPEFLFILNFAAGLNPNWSLGCYAQICFLFVICFTAFRLQWNPIAPSNQQNIYSKIKNYYLITLMTDLG